MAACSIKKAASSSARGALQFTGETNSDFLNSKLKPDAPG